MAGSGLDRAMRPLWAACTLGEMEHAGSILGVRVDLMTRQGIHPRQRQHIAADAVRVF